MAEYKKKNSPSKSISSGKVDEEDGETQIAAIDLWTYLTVQNDAKADDIKERLTL